MLQNGCENMLREGAGLSRLAGSLFEVTGLAENTIVQRVAALVIGLGGQQHSTVLYKTQTFI